MLSVQLLLDKQQRQSCLALVDNEKPKKWSERLRLSQKMNTEKQGSNRKLSFKLKGLVALEEIKNHINVNVSFNCSGS